MRLLALFLAASQCISRVSSAQNQQCNIPEGNLAFVTQLFRKCSPSSPQISKRGDHTLGGRSSLTARSAFALPSVVSSISPATAKMVAGKLYPASTVPILFQTFLMTREETQVPRGAVVGFTAQTISVLTAVPIIAVVQSLTNVPFTEINWLHWVEAAMLHVSVHIQAMSFRQAVRSYKEKKALPPSAMQYGPMMKTTSLLFALIGLVAFGHVKLAGESWPQTEFLGGFLDLPTEGIVSFPVWIAHWSMVFDFFAQVWYMWCWKECTNNNEWKNVALLHVPYCITNLVVIMNHLQRDQVVLLRLLHPVLVFVGSIATLFGMYQVAATNGWRIFGDNKQELKPSLKTIKPAVEGGTFSEQSAEFANWDMSYTAVSLLFGAVLSYASLYLAV